MTIHGTGRFMKFLIDDLPPLNGKNPVIAGILGFCFGGVGLGLYFWSWKDFLYPVVIFFLAVLTMSFLLPVIGAFPGWLVGGILAAGWGAWRASGS
jgi:hypothetical protein